MELISILTGLFMIFNIFIYFLCGLNHLSRGFHAFIENITSWGFQLSSWRVVPTTGVEPVPHCWD